MKFNMKNTFSSLRDFISLSCLDSIFPNSSDVSANNSLYNAIDSSSVKNKYRT